MNEILHLISIFYIKKKIKFTISFKWHPQNMKGKYLLNFLKVMGFSLKQMIKKTYTTT